VSDATPAGDGPSGTEVSPERQSASEAAEANGGFDGCEAVTFTGPALTFDLPEDADVVAVVRNGEVEPFWQHGRTIRRTAGHFGRGTWTVRYR
jgi:hypothetical protein